MGRKLTGKTHIGERRETRPNGDIYVYERVTAYNEKTRKTYTVSQRLKGKIMVDAKTLIPTRPRKMKAAESYSAIVSTTRKPELIVGPRNPLPVIASSWRSSVSLKYSVRISQLLGLNQQSPF